MSEELIVNGLIGALRRDLETTKFVCRDKDLLATIFVMQTQQNIEESSDKQTDRTMCWKLII